MLVGIRRVHVLAAAGVASVVALTVPWDVMGATGTVYVSSTEAGRVHNYTISNPPDGACLSLHFGEHGLFLGNATDRSITVYRAQFCKTAINTVGPRRSSSYQGGANPGYQSLMAHR
ncbi:MAG TPA: hypothetical protein VGL20_03170 [Candidatus Dormibacteraeota bacterium]